MATYRKLEVKLGDETFVGDPAKARPLTQADVDYINEFLKGCRLLVDDNSNK